MLVFVSSASLSHPHCPPCHTPSTHTLLPVYIPPNFQSSSGKMEKPQKDTSFSDMMKKFYEEDKKHDEKFSELEAKRDALRSRMHSSTARIQADIENAERLLEYVATEKMKVQLKRASRAKVAEPSVKKRASIKDIFTVRSQTLTSSGDDESSPAISSSRDTSMVR